MTIERKRSYDRRRKRALQAEAQDIAGLLGKPRRPARRRKAVASLRAFAETYFPARFNRPWSADHLRVLELMERCARRGGTFAVAMPRGSGKTALCLTLCLWAVLAGLRRYALLVGATKPAVTELIEGLKTELANNAALAEDFPREVGPFSLLEDEPRRARGQRCDGRRTHVAWLAEKVVFASIPGSACPGATIRVATITGRIRGAIHVTADGRQLRPDLIVADDPQTDASARSATQTDVRERTILTAIKGLAGLGVEPGIVIPCTVIRRGDLADRFLDASRHPDVQRLRTKLLYAMPERMDLWDEYARVLGDDVAAGGDGARATEFYRAHREAMDRGAKVAWEHQYAAHELSAVQHAMNAYLFNRRAFFAEYQQEPEDDRAVGGQLTREEVLARANGRPPGQAPTKTQWITAYVDVHKTLLYWHVAAWQADWTGCRLESGAWPEQPDASFTLATARRTLADAYPGRGKEGAIHAGLSDLIARLFARVYPRDDGAALSIDLLGIDSGYEPDVVAGVIRASRRGRWILPTKGVGMTAASRPFPEYKPEPGTTIGHHWRLARAPQTGLLTLHVDVNRWKSFFRDRLRVPIGDPGAFTLNGRPDPFYADHCVAEYPTETSGPYGRIEIWRQPPHKPDNHLWDCAVGCCALASRLGCRMREWAPSPAPRRGRIVVPGG